MNQILKLNGFRTKLAVAAVISAGIAGTAQANATGASAQAMAAALLKGDTHATTVAAYRDFASDYRPSAKPAICGSGCHGN